MRCWRAHYVYDLPALQLRSLGSWLKMGASTQVKYICNATGEDCSACRYHCTRMPDVDLSPAAYTDGKFPPGCSSKDFVRIDQAEFQVYNSRQPLHCKLNCTIAVPGKDKL